LRGSRDDLEKLRSTASSLLYTHLVLTIPSKQISSRARTLKVLVMFQTMIKGAVATFHRIAHAMLIPASSSFEEYVTNGLTGI
jgi:hypothetical protein